jgi:hypothetical protein
MSKSQREKAGPRVEKGKASWLPQCNILTLIDLEEHRTLSCIEAENLRSSVKAKPGSSRKIPV